MKPRSSFLLAAMGLVLTVLSAYRLAIASDNDGPMPRDARSGHSSDSQESREFEVGDTVLVSLTGDAVVTYLRFLAQSPHEGEGTAVLTVPMKVCHLGKDAVLVEHTANLEAGPDRYRVDLRCTLLRDKITFKNAVASKPRTDAVRNSDSTAKPQLVQARAEIHDFNECSDYRLETWKRMGEMIK